MKRGRVGGTRRPVTGAPFGTTAHGHRRAHGQEGGAPRRLLRAGSLALAVVAAVISCLPNKTFTADQLVLYLLALCLAIFPFGVVLLVFQFGWLCLGDLPPTNVQLLVMIAAEWVVACLTASSGCAAFAVRHQNCASGGNVVCVLYLVAAAIACASGALAVASALGMLWILRSRPAQAP